jgi:hypothetical protein
VGSQRSQPTDLAEHAVVVQVALRLLAHVLAEVTVLGFAVIEQAVDGGRNALARVPRQRLFADCSAQMPVQAPLRCCWLAGPRRGARGENDCICLHPLLTLRGCVLHRLIATGWYRRRA